MAQGEQGRRDEAGARLGETYERLPIPAPEDRDANDRFRRRRRLYPVVLVVAVRAGLAATVAGAFVAGVLWMPPLSQGQGRGATQGGPPPDPLMVGLTIRLDPGRVRPGGLVTRTLHGAWVHATTTGVDADFERWDGHRWIKIYTLNPGARDGLGPVAWPVGEEPRLRPDMGLVGDQPKRWRVPPVPPGEYRLAEPVSVRRDDRAAVDEVVYARLRVTG